MLEFLRQLAPRHPDALQPASPLRRMAAPGVSDPVVPEPDAEARAYPGAAAAAGNAAPDGPPPVRPASLEDTVPRLAHLEAPDRPPGTAPRSLAMEVRNPTGRRLEQQAGTGSSSDGTAPAGPVAPARPRDRPAPGPDRRDPPALTAAVAVAGQPAPAIPPPVAAPVSHATVARFAQERNAPGLPPTIHVSIDRVEVRAPPPSRSPPPPPRPEPAREPQSLHEYLKGKVAP